MENQTQTVKKSWLQRLKDESWEAELLVSAVAIFAILKSFAALDWLLYQFIDRLDPSQYDIGYFILVFGYLAIGILAAMFTIHFAFRAYWIGLVGLNSVFPDYGLEDSAYSPIYTKKILQSLPKVSDSIRKIDELCSVIFSAAFAFMMIYLFLTIASSLYLILFNVLSDFIPSWILLIPLGLLARVAIAGMFVSIPANMKKFRNNKTIQNLYFLNSRWGTLPFYGPFYKSILQITMLFGSNFKKKKGLVKMVLLMLFVGILFGSSKLISSNYGYLLHHSKGQDHTKLQSSFFASLNENEEFLLTPEINSDIVKEATVRLFIPLFEHEIALLRNACAIEESENIANKEQSERTRIRNRYLECFQNQHQILVDKKIIKVRFLKSDHPRTGQYGISGFVDLKGFKKGQHKLTIRKILGEKNEKEWRIPFYYSP